MVDFGDRGLCFKDLVDAFRGRARLCHEDNEIRDDYHREQDLGHVADERDDIARFHSARVDVDRAEPDNRDDRAVGDEVGDRAEQRRKLTDAHGGSR